MYMPHVLPFWVVATPPAASRQRRVADIPSSEGQLKRTRQPGVTASRDRNDPPDDGAAGASGDRVEPPDDLLSVNHERVVIEHRVEVEPGTRRISGDQVSQRRALVERPLREPLDDPGSIVAALAAPGEGERQGPR